MTAAATENQAAGTGAAAPAVAPLVITGCGVVSPAGHGLEPLAGGATAGTGADTAADTADLGGDFPPLPLSAVPDPRVEEVLGSKGVRALDRTAKLALVAASHALTGLAAPLSDADRVRTGVVIGTGAGSVRSSTEFLRETLVREKPYLVRANQFPRTAMNFCAGQLAIWNALRGVNTTVADGRVSGLSAFRYARNAIARGHVDRVLVGAAEELCAQTAWAWQHSGALAPGAAVGEGAAVFVVEPPQGAAAAGRTPLAEVLACEVGTSGSAGVRRGLARCVERALRRSGAAAADVGAAVLGASAIRGLRAAEEDAVRTALGALPPRVLRPAAALGESYSASAALQVAALLADWRETGTDGGGDGDRGGVAVVTSIGDDGYTGCLVMRRA